MLKDWNNGSAHILFCCFGFIFLWVRPIFHLYQVSWWKLSANLPVDYGTAPTPPCPIPRLTETCHCNPAAFQVGIYLFLWFFCNSVGLWVVKWLLGVLLLLPVLLRTCDQASLTPDLFSGSLQMQGARIHSPQYIFNNHFCKCDRIRYGEIEDWDSGEQLWNQYSKDADFLLAILFSFIL